MCTTKISHLNFPDTLGRTRLHYTVRAEDFKGTQALLEAGADANIIDAFGNTPLSLACIDKPNVAVVRLLLKYNANCNLERPGNMDLLLECVLNCKMQLQVAIIEILLDHGKNINSTDELTNRSCMHIVAMTGYTPLAELLLKMGAILNIRDNFNYTPIKVATFHGNIELLKVIQAHLNRSILI